MFQKNIIRTFFFFLKKKKEEENKLTCHMSIKRKTMVRKKTLKI